MLSEYFTLHISPEGLVETLPLLLRDFTPNLDKLPSFLMRLGPQVSDLLAALMTILMHVLHQVNWTSEVDCFDTFLRELAYFYIPGPLHANGTTTASPSSEEEDKAEQWQIQHILFPSMRRYLVAPKSLLDRDVVQVASLPDLYRVFERC